jgi:hypothetical protein
MRFLLGRRGHPKPRVPPPTHPPAERAPSPIGTDTETLAENPKSSSKQHKTQPSAQ